MRQEFRKPTDNDVPNDPEPSEAEPASEDGASGRDGSDVPGFDIAKWWLNARRLRESVFGAEVFKEPDWAIMLDLYATGPSGKRIQVTDVPIMTGLSRTTARRHLGELEEAGWITHVEDAGDHRRTLVSLSDKGWVMMTLYFRELIEKMDRPLPGKF
jgi:DNA-binding MarR family transcriptional regulator